MPTEYFEQRERALLGDRYEQLYAAPQETAERGVTVSALRASRSSLPQKPTSRWKHRPSARRPSWCMRRSSNPDATRTTTRACSTRRSRRRPRQPRCWACSPGCVCWTCAPPPAARAASWQRLCRAGRVVSNEYVAARAEILKSNLERMGVPNAVVLNETPARIAEALPEFFDRVLVDAPCSGEGMFRKEPVARQQHCEALVKQCAELGADILDVPPLRWPRAGSWCTPPAPLRRRRTRGRWRPFCSATRSSSWPTCWAMWTTPSAARARPTAPEDCRWTCAGCAVSGPVRAARATLWPGWSRRARPAPCLPQGEYTPEEQLWLDAAAAAAKRPRARAASRPESRTPVLPAAAGDSRACREAVQGRKPQPGRRGRGDNPRPEPGRVAGVRAGVFPALAGASRRGARRRRAAAGAFPQTNLHVLRAGVFVGSVQKGRFVPEHHLFTAFGAQCVNREELTLADPRCVEYLSGREVEARTAADGWCCVTVDGWPLGGGKVSGGRVKNHYPKALRLL